MRAAQRYAPADHMGVATEVPPPERVGEHHGLGRVREVVRGRERAALHRIRAAQPEEIRAGMHRRDLLREGFAGQVSNVEVVGGNILERLGLLPPPIKFRGRCAAIFDRR